MLIWIYKTAESKKSRQILSYKKSLSSETRKSKTEMSLTVIFVVINLHKLSPISLTEHRITINSLREAYIKNSKAIRPWSFTDMNETQLRVKVPCNHQNNPLTHSSLIFKIISWKPVICSSAHDHQHETSQPVSMKLPYMATRMPSGGFSISAVQAFQQRICSGIGALVASHFHTQPSQ